MQAISAPAKSIALAPSGTWATVATQVGTIMHVELPSLHVAPTPLAVGSSSAGLGSTEVVFISEDHVAVLDGSSMAHFLHLQPHKSNGNPQPHGVNPDLHGPGGTCSPVSGRQELGASISCGLQPTPTVAADAGLPEAVAMAEQQEVWMCLKPVLQRMLASRW
jgi:hypothetical protein